MPALLPIIVQPHSPLLANVLKRAKQFSASGSSPPPPTLRPGHRCSCNSVRHYSSEHFVEGGVQLNILPCTMDHKWTIVQQRLNRAVKTVISGLSLKADLLIIYGRSIVASDASFRCNDSTFDSIPIQFWMVWLHLNSQTLGLFYSGSPKASEPL